jgi:hypothetical protein
MACGGANSPHRASATWESRLETRTDEPKHRGMTNAEPVGESICHYARIDRTDDGTRANSDFVRLGEGHCRACRQRRDPFAELADNDATRSLVRMLPITIDMRDHLRQEKTGNLPSALPAIERQLDFSIGTLGLWSSNHFVIYYRDGRVPQPGIVILGRVTGDVSIFDRPGAVTVRVERIN